MWCQGEFLMTKTAGITLTIKLGALNVVNNIEPSKFSLRLTLNKDNNQQIAQCHDWDIPQ